MVILYTFLGVFWVMGTDLRIWTARDVTARQKLEEGRQKLEKVGEKKIIFRNNGINCISRWSWQDGIFQGETPQCQERFVKGVCDKVNWMNC
jgi:hypothetical protein